jgi:hypothetical protein
MKSGFPQSALFRLHPDKPALRIAEINACSVELLSRDRMRDMA